MPRPMAARPRLVRVLAAALLIGAPTGSVSAADAPREVPPEAGVVVLPDAPILQAMVGDVDGDGVRELLRLVSDAADATYLEVWALKDAAWGSVGERIRLLAGTEGPDFNRVYADAPARLLAWHDGERERVLLATQPRFEELGAAPACCLLLHDVQIRDGRARTVAFGPASDSADALLALDLDGDGRDELLSTRSLPPLGDISFPMRARVHRFDGTSFAAPVVTDLQFGSGDTPLVLGETDGVPGEEAAVISTLGPPGLFRITLGDGDLLHAEPAQFPRATAAAALPLEAGPAIVVVEGGETRLARWPAGGVPETVASAMAGELLGVAETARGLRIVLARALPSQVAILGPDLRTAPGPTVRETPAVAQLSARGIASYAGPIPGGGLDGRPALVYGGRLVGALPAGDDGPRDDVTAIASFARAAPVGLVGDGAWMAVMHSQFGVDRLAREGGILDDPVGHVGASLTIAPLEQVLTPEPDGSATIDPPTAGLVDAPNTGRHFVGVDGFTVDLDAPAGSVVLPLDVGGEGALQHVVPSSGRTTLTMALSGREDAVHRPAAVVLTPAGHGFLADWEVRVLDAPPRIDLHVETPLGSANVIVDGSVRPPSEVDVAGRRVDVAPDGSFRAALPAPPWPTDVEVTAIDPVGNHATEQVSVVGFVDYRGLPWIPLVGISVAVVAAVLFLRAPGARPGGGEHLGDARLEELEPDEQPS